MTNGRVSEILSGESLTLIEGEASVNTFLRTADQAKDDVHLSREREKDTNYHRMCSQYTNETLLMINTYSTGNNTSPFLIPIITLIT